MKAECQNCHCEFECATGAFNRARKNGFRVFCSRSCAGMARRSTASLPERRAAKAEYDRLYREKNFARIKAKKAEYFRRTYDSDEARVARKERMPLHVEYCRRPEYQAWKSEYDRQRRASEYGEFAECYLLTLEIRRESLTQADDYEIRKSAGTINKHQQRKREYERLNSNKSENGPLGNASISQGGQYSTGRGGRDCIAGS